MSEEINKCECHACIKEFNIRDGAFPLSTSRMIPCPLCRNKRCPKASDHRLECTNSNDPNQAGSVYQQPEYFEIPDFLRRGSD